MTNNKLSIFSFLSTDFYYDRDSKKSHLLVGISIAITTNIVFAIIGFFIGRGLAVLSLILFIPCILSYYLIKKNRLELAIHLMSMGYALGFIGSPWLIGRAYAPILIYVSILLVANLMFRSFRVKALYFIATFLSIYAYVLANTYTRQSPLPCIELIEFIMLMFNVLFITNSLNIIFDDINGYKKELKKREYFLNKIIDTSPDAIFVKNNKRQFILVNDKFAEIEGRPKEVFIGKTAVDMQGEFEGDAVLAEEDYLIIQTGKPITNQLVTGIENGKQLWFAYSKFPITDEDGRVVGIFGVTKNITEQKRQEMVLNQKNIELQKYIESNMQLENFAHIASHDLREPIRSIVSFSQLLKRNAKNKLSKDEDEYLDFVITASQNMATQIEDLLTYALIDTKKVNFKPVNIDLLLHNIARNIQAIIDEKQAQIDCQNIPDTIMANPTQLTQLLQNLILNAIKFSRPDTPPVININGEEQPNHWQFNVIDNGIGIAPEYYEKIFLLFRRLHTREVYQGTGIGLAICKKVVDHHNGKIWVTSNKEQGTTFHFTISKDLGQPIQKVRSSIPDDSLQVS